MSFVIAGNSASTGYNLTRSLRTRSSASAYLSRTPATAGNQKTWTYSNWVKRGTLGVNQQLFAVGTGSGLYFYLRILSTDVLEVFTYDSSVGSFVWQLQTTQVFRDPSAWYHIIISTDTTQATAANRVKIYINGTQVTALAIASYPSLNYDTRYNANVASYINSYVGTAYFDGYTAEFNSVDGQALTPSSFGSTNALTGVWQPARYTGTYGTNGFYLPFTDNSALTTSSNVGLGKDFSGNGNYWTTNNISITAGVTYDSMTDVPTLTSATAANFAVMNPLNTAVAPINGNLAIQGNNSWRGVISTIMLQPSGLYYFEAFAPVALQRIVAGIAPNAIAKTSAWQTVSTFKGIASDNTNCNFCNNGSVLFSLSGTAANDVLQFAINTATGNVWGGRNNTFYSSAGAATGNPATGANPTWTSVSFTDMFAGFQAYETGSTVWANFGQRPFTYTAPTGFVALNTYNLPTSTIVKGGSVMNAVTWSGASGGTNLNVTGFGFQPDFVWGKTRNQAYDHYLQDSVRGITNGLSSNLTAAESTTSGSPTSFIADGFNISSTAGWTSLGNSIVTWAWKAGQGTNTSNTNGTITSTVSVNASAGFSVVTWTGTGANATVGHGLGVAPQLIINKPRNAADNWISWHTSLGALGYIYLNLTNASASAAAVWNSTLPTSSVFSVGTSSNINSSAQTMVSYCWTPIAGYSAFGSLIGNGSADGPFTYTGFRPKFILFKNASAVASWWIFDTVRNTYNVADLGLRPNLSDAESTFVTFDILSNGFKVRTTDAGLNGSGNTIVYACWAENPFKNSLAR